MTELADRIAALSPEKRKLLERRMAREGLGRRERHRSIPRRAEGDRGPFPLTYGQRRLWFIDRLNPGTPAYNIPFAGRLRGPLRPDLLASSLREVIGRHEVLRSRFVERDGRPVQVIDPDPSAGTRPGVMRLPVVDLSALPEARRDPEARRLTRADPQTPFDLARGPVVRVTLLRLGPRLHDLLVTMPHIVTDAWSMAVLFRELPRIYDALRKGRPSPLEELPIQVADYALWERARLDAEDGGSSETLERELDFWREHLAGATTVLELPTDRPRPPVQTFPGIRRPVKVPPATARRLESLVEREGATLFMALLASFAAVLSRWTGQDDVLLSSPLATRSEPETQGLIGFFIDNAVVRADLSGDPSFRRLLSRVRESSLATFAHQGVPFEKVAEAVGAGGDLSRPPLAQASFVLQNVHIPSPEFDELTLVHARQTDTGAARFDVSLGLFEADDGPEGWLDYNTDLFDDTTMARLERDWHDLLAAAVECPDAALSTLARLRPATRHQLLHEWNEPAWDWPRAGPGAPRRTTVVDLVTHWAGRSPDAVALEEPPGASGVSRQVTYRELTGRARRLARRLVAEGVGPDAPVAVAVPRSIDQVVALLAVLEAGGCYVPVDPSYPEPRRAFLVADAEVRAALVAGGADAEAVEVFRRAGVPVIDPAGAAGADEPEPVRSGPESGPDPESLAYVLYTSGSTGEPKGTAVPHRAVVRLVEGLDAYAPIGPADVLLALAPLAFDASTFELWGALGRGARLALSPEDRAGVRPESGSGSESGSGPGWGLEGLETALARHRVTVLWLTAGLFHLVADRRPAMLGGLRRLLSGGDVLSPAAVQAVLDELPELALVDGYGPTEATTFTCCHPVGPTGSTRSIPIGRPVPGTRVHVVDRSLRPTPPGVPGELSIGGAGLARGYRGRAAATAERFVPDPFGPSGSGAGSGVGSGEGARLYRSGDRVRWRPDGRLEFLGRLDRQVKVRGYRIEPGEVEAALEGHPAVEDAVVDLRSGRLVGYVVLRRSGTSGGHDHDPGALRGFLEGRLPEFMIPSLFVAVDALPLTANGKVDRAALPAPEEALAAAAGGEAPATAAEETLAGIWREVLGLERLGVHDRFFDLGGDSILAIQVISRAVEAGLPLQPRHLFEHPTVAGLAAVVGSGATAGSGAVVDEGPVSGAVPLGPAQRWLLEGLDPPVPDHWNMALLLEPRDGVVAGAERLRLDRLERAARALTLRHDMLRARFHRAPEGWRQEVEPAAPDDRPGVPGPVAAVDLRALPPEAEERSARAAVAALQGSLDLARGPLFRLVRFDRPGAPGRSRPRSRSRPRTQLLVLVHHLVADAVSLRVLLDDLHRSAGSASGRVAAPRRTASYRRWVDALAEWARDPERSAEERAFWRGVAGSGGEAPGGSAKERRETEARAGSVTAGVPPEVTRRLVTEVPETLRASLEELILAAVTAALDPERGPGGETGTAWVEMEGHGRRLPARSAGEALDLSRTVGWFTTQYPVRVRLPERRDGDDREGGASGPGSGVGRRVPRMLRAVKEALRAVPSGGVGYAALRWPDPVDPVDPADPADPADPLQAALAGLPRPALSFNFLGRLDEAFGDFRLVAGGAGPVRHPRAPRPHPLELVAFVLGDELHTVWTFSPSVHRRSEVEALAERTVAMLRRLARAAGEGEREGAAEALDASDFPHSDLGAGDLERLLDDLGEDG